MVVSWSHGGRWQRRRRGGQMAASWSCGGRWQRRRHGGRWQRLRAAGVEEGDGGGVGQAAGRVRVGGGSRESRGGSRESARWGWSRRLASRNAKQQRNGRSIIQFRRIRVRERGHWTCVVFAKVRMR
ncbi:unnamed protein product [Linum trigynum]|uniref:Uncharacterized protein n=1 Tax=Linum trigynum TaxID=586398 RepID=A0AAV2CGQ1_9ROSI